MVKLSSCGSRVLFLGHSYRIRVIPSSFLSWRSQRDEGALKACAILLCVFSSTLCLGICYATDTSDHANPRYVQDKARLYYAALRLKYAKIWPVHGVAIFKKFKNVPRQIPILRQEPCSYAAVRLPTCKSRIATPLDAPTALWLGVARRGKSPVRVNVALHCECL